MALDATAVRVALTGRVWVAPETATFPATAAAAPGAGFVDLGYTTDDGVTINIGKDVTDLMGWQSIEILRSIVTAEPKTISLTLRQTDKNTILSTLNGTITSTGTAPNQTHRWVPNEGEMPVKSLLIDFTDGTLVYRFGFRRAQQIGEAEINLQRGDSLTFPQEWRSLAASPQAWFIDSNDPAWAVTV